MSAFRRSFAITAQPVSARQVRVIWASDELALDGGIIRAAGIDVSFYNDIGSPVLRDHDPSQPIATASEVTTGSRCRALWTFPAGVSTRIDEALAEIKAGVLGGVSIGFEVLDQEPVDPRQPRGAQIFTSVRILEMSAVAIPADRNAKVIERALHTREGRVLSGANAGKLRQAHDMAENCRALVADVLDGATGDGDGDEERAARDRRRRAVEMLALAPPPLTIAEEDYARRQRDLDVLTLARIP